ncbi:MAG: glycosyltransferase family 9 protein [Calditrichota bacterium]
MKFGKRIEIFSKNLLSALLRCIFSQKEYHFNPDLRKILFIRYGGIGDMILTLPVLQTARRKYPQATLDVLCDKKNADPLKGKNHYDFMVNFLHYPSLTFGLLTRLAGPKAGRVAGNQGQYAYFYNRPVELLRLQESHVLETLFRLSADVTGANIPELKTPWIEYDSSIKNEARRLFDLIISGLSLKKENPGIIALNLTAGLERREWPVEKFGEFLKIILDRNGFDGVAVITDPKKPEGVTELMKVVDNRLVIVLPVVADFRVLMEFLRFSFMLITPDTSLSHAASCMGTPLLNLIIGENINKWAPYGIPHVMVVSEDPLSLKDLPVQKVVDGFERLLKMIGK